MSPLSTQQIYHLNQIEKQIKAYNALVRKLEKTIAHSAKYLNSKKRDFWRRTFIQTMYSDTEAEIYLLKLKSLKEYHFGHIRLSSGEEHILFNKQYRLSDSGTIKTSDLHTKMIPDLKFALKIFAKTNSIDFEPDFNDNRWEHFKAFISIRNRIVHPKNEIDLVISDDDMDICIDAWEWFRECIIEQIKMVSKRYQELIDELDKEKKGNS